jgi:hypothetical protein
VTDDCRSCHRPIIWAVNGKTGKSMPVDADPADNGNIELLPRAGAAPEAVVHAQPPMLATGLYLSHFATCPDRDRWRKK